MFKTRKSLTVLSASAVATIAGNPVYAQDTDVFSFTGLEIGGWYSIETGYSPQKSIGDKVEATTDYGIFFTPFVVAEGVPVLDHLEILGYVTLSEFGTSASLSISGPFGELSLGPGATARTRMHFGAPNVGIGEGIHRYLNVVSPGRGDWGTLTSTNTGILHGESSDRISYFTPRFKSIQIGGTYTRDDGSHVYSVSQCFENPVPPDFSDICGNLHNRQADIQHQPNSHVVDFGLNYIEELDEVGMAVSAGYGTTFGDYEGSGKAKIIASGVNLRWKNWTLGGSFTLRETGGILPDNEVNRWLDGKSWGGGVSYADGPWTFSFRYFHGVDVDDEAIYVNFLEHPDGSLIFADGFDPIIDTNEGQNGFNESLQTFEIGASYDIARGIRISAFASYAIFEEDTPDGGERLIFFEEPYEAAPNENFKGLVIGTSLSVSF